jgi:hypothetical protein
MRSFITCTLLQDQNDQVKEDDMGGACSTNGGRRGMHIGYWWESQQDKYHQVNQDIDGWIILKWILER